MLQLYDVCVYMLYNRIILTHHTTYIHTHTYNTHAPTASFANTATSYKILYVCVCVCVCVICSHPTHISMITIITYIKLIVPFDYDMIWHDMIWYDVIWYDMIWLIDSNKASDCVSEVPTIPIKNTLLFLFLSHQYASLSLALSLSHTHTNTYHT